MKLRDQEIGFRRPKFRERHVPLADVHGVIEFYSLFYNEPTGKRVIRVCTDQACALKDAQGILNHLCYHHGIQPGQTTAGNAVTIEASPCLGLCEQAPAVLTADNGQWTIGNGSAESDRPPSMVYGPTRMLTANCGNGTTSLSQYGKYEAFEKALAMNPEEVVAEVKASGLVGRGGAAFPQWHVNRVEMTLGFVLVLMLGNLRGIRESGRIFAAPTYVFVVSLLALIAAGAWRAFTGTIHPVAGTISSVAHLWIGNPNYPALVRIYVGTKTGIPFTGGVTKSISSFVPNSPSGPPLATRYCPSAARSQENSLPHPSRP